MPEVTYVDLGEACLMPTPVLLNTHLCHHRLLTRGGHFASLVLVYRGNGLSSEDLTEDQTGFCTGGLGQSLSLWPLMSGVDTLSLTFLICKMGLMINI